MIETLIENGFSEQEARVYLVCLELGLSPASRIASKIGQNRVTTYSTLKKMIQHGFVSSLQKGNTIFYVAISPQELFKKKELMLNKLQSSLPLFATIQNNNKYKISSKLYEGIEGLKTAFMEIVNTPLKDDEKFLAFTGTNIIDPQFKLWLEKEFLPYRLSIPTQSKVIMNNRSDFYFEYSTNIHECLILEDCEIFFDNEIVIYGYDQVAVLMYQKEEIAALIITSKSLYNTLHALFHLIWKAYYKV